VLHGCGKLTRLELQWCNVLGATAGAVVVDGPPSLVHLHHLDLFPVEQCILSAATLPCLHHLTYLQVCNPSVENLQGLGALTNLQELCLSIDDDLALAVAPSSVPGLSFPTSLTSVELLARVEVGVLSLFPATLKHLDLSCSFSGPVAANGPGYFLSGIARLAHLTALLVLVEPHGLLDWPAPGLAYSALTVTTNLVELSIESVDLPEGIWPFVFPSGHKLPHLTSLHIMDEEPVRDPAPAVWGPADIASLVSCCPNLCAIDKMYLQRGPHVSELQQLTGLTRIFLVVGSHGYVAAADDCMHGLAVVTQMQSLQLHVYNLNVSVAALLPLTSLKYLTMLDFCGHAIDNNGDDDADNDVGLYLEQVSSKPDVCSSACFLGQKHMWQSCHITAWCHEHACSRMCSKATHRATLHLMSCMCGSYSTV
jgi:hypothetical protein